MSEDERASKIKRLRSYVKRRNEVRAEIKDLEDDDKKLGDKIKGVLEELGERDTTTLIPKLPGYRLDRPQKVVFNEERLSTWLREKAPEVHGSVFEEKVIFNKKAFDEAVQAGDVPDVESVLSDDEYVKFEDMSPRLMPTKAKKG